jgi:hypothetical protein
MMTNYGQELLRFPLNLLYNGNSYYIDRIARLEDALADVPKQLHIELMGDGEIDVDWALVIRDVLNQRSADTLLITQARSTLKNGSVLVWLLGDRRLIREDGRLFFRRALFTEESGVVPEKIWSDEDLEYVDSYSEADPEEASHAQVLHYINEFLPVRELVGRMIDVNTLRQFGLIGNEKLDHFLASSLGSTAACGEAQPKSIKPASERTVVSQPSQE